VNPEPAGDFELDPNLPLFSPECPLDEMDYRALRCPCGEAVFRVAGWPRVVSGPGGFFWRTLTRVWREASGTTADGERIDSPFRLPIEIRCGVCDREAALFENADAAKGENLIERDAPRESYRCRDCRRGLVELVVGMSTAEASDRPNAVDVIGRCHRCHHQVRIAASANRDSAQKARLDLLYGRR
jgi:hypothetical protein